MELAHVWKHYLANWPSGLARAGVVVTDREQVVFVSFLMSDTVVMFERQAPDSVGGRKVVLPYALIQAIKVTEPIGNEPFLESGFSESLRAGSTTPAKQPAGIQPPTTAARPQVTQRAT